MSEAELLLLLLLLLFLFLFVLLLFDVAGDGATSLSVQIYGFGCHQMTARPGVMHLCGS